MTYAEATNMTGIADMFRYTNNVTGNVFGTGILLSAWFIVFLSLVIKGEQANDSAIVAGFFTSMVGIIIFLLGLVTGYHLFVAFCSVIIPALWAYYGKAG